MPVEAVVVQPAIYRYPLISWSSVLAGTAVAIAIGVMLNLLGAAIGASAVNPFAAAAPQAKALTIGAGLWLAFSNLVALQVGGFIAARSAAYPDHNRGMMQGLTVWALGTIVTVVLTGSLLSRGMMQAADPDLIAAASGAMTPADMAAAAEAAKHAAEVLAWWMFATVVLGLIGAVAGGRIGAEHPAWIDRPRAP